MSEQPATEVAVNVFPSLVGSMPKVDRAHLFDAIREAHRRNKSGDDLVAETRRLVGEYESRLMAEAGMKPRGANR